MDTWNLASRSLNLQGISFANTDVGCVVGDSGMILMTYDGGKYWHERRITNKDLNQCILM